jgi:hypothetical protein
MAISSLTEYSPDGPRLWGRDELLNRIVDEASKGCTIVGMEGVGGVGKSEFATRLSSTIQSQNGGPSEIFIDCSGSPTEALLIATLASGLKALPVKTIDNLEANIPNYIEKLVPAARKIALALIADFSKESKLASTVEAISEMVSAGDLNHSALKELEALDTNNMRSLIDVYLKFVAEKNVSILISLDNYESLDTSGRNFLRLLIERKPSNTLILIVVNTEKEPKSDWMPLMAAHLRYYGGIVEAIDGLREQEIGEWYKLETGGDATRELQKTLLVESKGGRPAILKLLIEHIKSGAESPRLPSYSEMHRARRARLSRHARNLCDLLALILPDVSIEKGFLKRAALRLAIDDFDAAIVELSEASLVLSSGNQVRVFHSSYRDTWASDLESDQVTGLAKIWFDTLRETGYDVEELTKTQLLPLIQHDLLENEAPALISDLSDRLISYGSVDGGLVLKRELWQNGTSSERKVLISVEDALKSAALQIDLGRYELAHEPLRAIESELDEGPQRIHADLLQMKLSLRLNKYEAVWAITKKFRERTPLDLATTIEYELIYNTGLRDVLNAEALHESLERLNELASQADEKARGTILRSMARSKAKLGEQAAAIVDASYSLELATGENDLRSIGNANLALAEAFRYDGQFAKSAEKYYSAIDFAGSIGNRDCEIWSWLGLVCNFLESHRHQDATEALSRAQFLVSQPDYFHPLETAHVVFLSSLSLALQNQPVDLESVAKLFESLKIAWPIKYLSKVVTNGELTGHIPI